MSGLKSFDPDYLTELAEKAAKEESEHKLKEVKRDIEAGLTEIGRILEAAKLNPATNLALALEEAKRLLSVYGEENANLKRQLEEIRQRKDQVEEQLRDNAQSACARELEKQVALLKGELSDLRADNAKKTKDCAHWKNECISWQGKYRDAAPHLRKQLKDCEAKFQKKCDEYNELLNSKYNLINKSSGK